MDSMNSGSGRGSAKTRWPRRNGARFARKSRDSTPKHRQVHRATDNALTRPGARFTGLLPAPPLQPVAVMAAWRRDWPHSSQAGCHASRAFPIWGSCTPTPSADLRIPVESGCAAHCIQQKQDTIRDTGAQRMNTYRPNTPRIALALAAVALTLATIGVSVIAPSSTSKLRHGSVSAMRRARVSNGGSPRRRRDRSWPAPIQTPPKSRNHCDEVLVDII